MPEVLNRLEEAVFRADGKQLFGLDAELELKARAQRDPQFEGALLLWVQRVINSGGAETADDAGKKKHDKKHGRSGKDSGNSSDMIEKMRVFKLKDPASAFVSLKDGIALGYFMNAIVPGSCKVDPRGEKLGMVAMANIDVYLKACVFKLNLPNAALFRAADLFDGKGLPAVTQNLYAVAKCVTEKSDWLQRKMPPLPDSVKGGGMLPQSQSGSGGPGPIKLPTKEDEARRIEASRPAKKWAPVQTAPRFSADDDDDDGIADGVAQCANCQNALEAGAKFCKACGSKVILRSDAASVAALEAAKAEHAAAIAQVEQQLASTRAELEKEQAARDDGSQAKARLTQELESAKSAHRKEQSRAERLENQLADLQQKYDTLLKQRQAEPPKTTASNTERLQRELASLEQRHDTEMAAADKSHADALRKLERSHAAEIDAVDDKLLQALESVRDLNSQLREANSTITDLKKALRDAQAKYKAERKAREEWADRYQASVAYRRRTSRASVLLKSAAAEHTGEPIVPTEVAAVHAAEPAAVAVSSPVSAADPDMDDFVIVLTDEQKNNLQALVDLIIAGQFKPLESQHRRLLDECRNLQQSEQGRREFASSLRSSLKKAQTTTVTEQSFGVLLDLCNAALTEQDAAEHTEYFTAKKFLRVLTSVYHIVQEKQPASKPTQVFMYEQASVKAHNLWRDQDFWEFMFIDELNRKYQQYFPDDTVVDPDFFTSLICKFVLEMGQHWELPPKFGTRFVHSIVRSSAFALQDPAGIEKQLKPFVDSGGKRVRVAAPPVSEGGSQSSPSSYSGGGSKSPKSRARKVQTSKAGGSFLSTLRGRRGTGEPMPEGRMIKQGQLAKRGSARKNWKLRWFVLKPGYLAYQERATPSGNDVPDVLGVIRLQRCYVGPAPFDRRPFTIVISSGADGMEYLLDADNVSNMHTWLTAIKSAIEDPLDAVERGVIAAQTDIKPAGNQPLLGAAAAAVAGLGVSPRADPRHATAMAKNASSDEKESVEQATSSATSAPTKNANVICHAIATAVFTAEAQTELSLSPGDRIAVLKKDGSGWWLGMALSSGKKGWFASEYVKEE